MEAWFAITVAAAFLQNVRSLLQKTLTQSLSTTAAAYVRFCYALPFAWLYVAALVGSGVALPAPNSQFLLSCVAGGSGQIVGTTLLLRLFQHRNFAVGTGFSKTEAVQAALFSLIFLGESVSLAGAIGIGVSLLGVWMLSLRGKLWPLAPEGDRWLPVLIGLGSGAGFAIAAVSYRAAALALDSGTPVTRAALTLAVVTVLQTLAMGAWIGLREPGQLAGVARAWRRAGVVGLCGAVASALWFTAMAMQNAAYVRALGQVELVFAFLTSWWVFGERIHSREVAGAALILAGIWLVLL